MQTSFCLELNGNWQNGSALNSWWLFRSGQRHTRQYMTWGRPFLCDTCNRPSKLLGIVTQFERSPGQLRAFSRSCKAWGFFFSFFTNTSTAFSAHFSSSSPCFQPRSFLTSGFVTANSEERPDIFLSQTLTSSLCLLWCDDVGFGGVQISSENVALKTKHEKS